MVDVKVVVGDSKVSLPKYETTGSAGSDVCARIGGDFYVKPGELLAVSTVLCVEIL